jgi:hypothetical protein
MRAAALALLLAGCPVRHPWGSGGDADGGPGGGDGAVPGDGGGVRPDGRPVDCPPIADCPPPTPGRVTICGEVLDTEDTGAVTTPIFVQAYDALDLIAGPNGGMPIAETTADACGRFQLTQVIVPASSYLAVLTDEATDSDTHVRTAVGLQVSGSERIVDLEAFATRWTTIDLWDDRANRPDDGSFGQIGVYLAIFENATPLTPLDGTPVAGVRLTQGGQPPGAERRWHFSDDRPLSRAEPMPENGDETGVNGAVILADVFLEEIGGSGGEPAGCMQWQSQIGGTAPGLIMVQEIRCGF